MNIREILFWKCSEGKRCSKISKTPKNLCKTVISSLTLQTCSLELQQNRLQERRFLLMFWNSWKYFKKKFIMESFYPGNKNFRILSFIKNHFMHFAGDVRKNSCSENFQRFPEKCLSVKGYVRYTFASLFYKSKREYLSN